MLIGNDRLQVVDRLDAIDAIVFAVMRFQLMLLEGSGRLGRFWSRRRQHIGDREDIERRTRIWTIEDGCSFRRAGERQRM